LRAAAVITKSHRVDGGYKMTTRWRKGENSTNLWRYACYTYVIIKFLCKQSQFQDHWNCPDWQICSYQ